jgi:hypothetical protein
VAVGKGLAAESQVFKGESFMSSGQVSSYHFAPATAPRFRQPPVAGLWSSAPVIPSSLEPQPQESVTLAAKFKVRPEALEIESLGNGESRSKRTLALVPEADRAKLEKLGVVFPDLEEVRSTEGLSADGRLEIVPVNGTGNANTTYVLRPHEVDNALLQKGDDGTAPIDGYIAQLLPEGTAMAPQGFEFRMGTSAAGAHTEGNRLRLNSLSDGLGGMAQSSLAGVLRLPYISSALPFLAVATAGGSLNRHLETLKETQDLLGYVRAREQLYGSDKIALELGVGVPELSVSARAEKQRLETKVLQAKSKLVSTYLTLAAGGASVLGYAAAGGAFGTGGMAIALTGAVAATPYLAGAGMMVGSAGLVVNSLNQLKVLSQEKADLLALQEQGQTHTLQTIEKVSPELRRPVATGEQMVPIQERLKAIAKEQRQQRLLTTAYSGGIATIAGTAAGISAPVLLPLSVGPGALLAGTQSFVKLKELGAEKKQLVERFNFGETMVPRQVERQDGSWNEERIPVSTLLADIEGQQKLHSLILTGAGSVGAMFGMTLGLGMSLPAASPVILVPAIVGSALFPDKAKAFAGTVSGFVAGRFGEEARIRKELMAENQSQTQATKEQLIQDLEPLVDQNPSLFYIPSKAEIRAARASGHAPNIGYFTYLNGLMDSYAASGSAVGRHQALQEIDGLLAQAPSPAQPYLARIKERLQSLYGKTETSWVAHEVALEMKKDFSQKVLGDSRVRDRLAELGYHGELSGPLKESLQLEKTPGQAQELLDKSRQGDREATLRLARSEVFAAACLYYKSQEELGSELQSRLLDALNRPHDDETLELVIKEVNHKLGRPMAPSTAGDSTNWWLGESTQGSPTGFKEPLRKVDFMALRSAAATLDKPLDITPNPTGASVEKGAVALEGPQARMVSAFRELHNIDSMNAGRLSRAFAALNDATTFQGLSPQEVEQKRVELGLELTDAKAKLSEQSPEIVALWDKARVDAEEEYFQNSIDEEFAAKVLAQPQVTEASQRLAVEPEQVKALYLSLLRAQNLGDSRALRGQMVDATGQQIDPRKEELLQTLDRSVTSVAAQLTGGGNDTVPSSAELGRPEADPQVATFLEANPTIEQVLQSEGLTNLAKEFQTSPDEVRHAYLTLVQANLNPTLTAKFEGLYASGDVQTVKTFQIGSRVGQLVQAAVKPSAELVARQVETGMAGPVVAAVLDDPQIKELALSLKVDATALMRTLLAADLAGDPTPLQALESRARGGDVQAQSELQMMQTLAQATLQAAAQANTPLAEVQQKSQMPTAA